MEKTVEHNELRKTMRNRGSYWLFPIKFIIFPKFSNFNMNFFWLEICSNLWFMISEQKTHLLWLQKQHIAVTSTQRVLVRAALCCWTRCWWFQLWSTCNDEDKKHIRYRSNAYKLCDLAWFVGNEFKPHAPLINIISD